MAQPDSNILQAILVEGFSHRISCYASSLQKDMDTWPCSNAKKSKRRKAEYIWEWMSMSEGQMPVFAQYPPRWRLAVEIEQQERVGAYGRCNLGGQSTQVKDIDFADHLVRTQLLSRTQETVTTFAVDVNAPKLAETSRCIFYTERRNQSYKWNSM